MEFEKAEVKMVVHWSQAGPVASRLINAITVFATMYRTICFFRRFGCLLRLHWPSRGDRCALCRTIGWSLTWCPRWRSSSWTRQFSSCACTGTASWWQSQSLVATHPWCLSRSLCRKSVCWVDSALPPTGTASCSSRWFVAALPRWSAARVAAPSRGARGRPPPGPPRC